MIKRLVKSTAAAIVFAASIVTVTQARELRVSSHEPQQGFYSSKILQAWIDETNSRLSGAELKLYPGAILGAPPAQAELVKAGVADVALVVTNYNPGLFPMSTVVEVPGVATTSTQGTAVLNALLDDGSLDGEYADYKVLALFTTPGYRFLMANEAVGLPTDLSGQKLRTPSKFGSTLFELLGATGVSIPAPQVYENLERGVVSGAVWVMDAYRTFRLNEVAPYITDIRFTASPMAILMNKNTYESLSDGDKAVLDETAGRPMSEWIASVVDKTDAEIEGEFRENADVTFVELNDEARAAWDEAVADAPARWVSEQPDAAAAQAVLNRAKEVADDQ